MIETTVQSSMGDSVDGATSGPLAARVVAGCTGRLVWLVLSGRRDRGSGRGAECSEPVDSGLHQPSPLALSQRQRQSTTPGETVAITAILPK